jgi:hypothetical protein
MLAEYGLNEVEKDYESWLNSVDKSTLLGLWWIRVGWIYPRVLASIKDQQW